MLQGDEMVRGRARGLRQTMSPPEITLWQILRHRSAGFKFRRQHPSGPYIADFYCHEVRLVVEVDSETHSLGDRPARDEARDRWFAERGLATLRIAAIDIQNNIEGVTRHILTTAASRHPGEE